MRDRTSRRITPGMTKVNIKATIIMPSELFFFKPSKSHLFKRRRILIALLDTIVEAASRNVKTIPRTSPIITRNAPINPAEDEPVEGELNIKYPSMDVA